MSHELSSAKEQLCSALNRYARVCSSTRDACLNGGQINSISELCTNLVKEANDITSYIQQLEGALTAVQAARNSISKISPISNLPAEILTCIFKLAASGQPCLVQRGYSGKISNIKYPLYPDSLAHVCSFWRRVATNTPNLWTHIDVALDHSLNPGLFARAKVYATRAGQLPLEIHISDPGSEREKARASAIREGKLKPGQPGYDPSHVWHDLHDFQFLASDSVNIKTLEMDLNVHNRYRETYYTMLEYFFDRCKPGVLTKYIARCSPWVYSPFIEPAETPHSDDGALLAVPIRQLDELWLGISSIRINGLFPHWGSKIYHKLVELYIDEGVPNINESELVNILRASPKLQVFHIQVALDELVEDESITRVHLEDLRELSLMIRDDPEAESIPNILRWITTGSKPLQLSLVDTPREVADFCSRANVARLFIWCPGRLASLLNQCRRLETLVLNARDAGTNDLSSILDDDFYDSDGEFGLASKSISPSTTRIDTLYLLWHSVITFEEVKVAVEKYSIQRLLIYYGRLSYQTDAGSIISENTRNIRAKLSTITACPNIEYHPDGYPESWTEDEPYDADGWIRESLRS
ncbi:unnamed protein product [Rhizoctonia solani]|uniref:F-box-like domain protein n=1 Tax=Rhizoctonia solani TaxID=456999 RepID=A0A8H3HRN9_9AGAM|nr:unnamed protein product [Rhizoctonia solani]